MKERKFQKGAVTCTKFVNLFGLFCSIEDGGIHKWTALNYSKLSRENSW